MKKIKIIKNLLKGRTIRDYRVYDWNNDRSSLDIWLFRSSSDQTKRFKPIYTVCIQRPLGRTDYYEYGSLIEMFREIDRDLGYELNAEGEFEIL